MHSASAVEKQASGKYFLIAFGLLNTLAFTLLFCWIAFLCGASVSKWQFPLGCISALVVNYFAAKFFISTKTKRFFIKTGVDVMLILAGSIIIGGYFYDASFDGQWYHQEVIYRVKQGYNPARQQLQVPPDEVMNTTDASSCTGVDKPVTVAVTNHPVNLKFINMNSFSKGTEIMAAAIYAVTNRIETGKGVNFILLAAAFFLALSLFYRFAHISVRKKWLLAALCAFNPLAIIQMCSYCVDGCNACWLTCLLLTCCLLFMENNRYYLLLLGSIIIAAINVKFTAFVFTGIYCLGFLIALLIYKRADLFKKVLITCIIAVIIGVFCCGFNPYVTNFEQKNDVFYGLKETQANILNLYPASFHGHNRFTKLFVSLSAHQGWYNNGAKSIWALPKIPFTFNKIDIYEACDVQQNLSALGPFFSGAMLAAMVLFIVALLRFRKMAAFKYAVAVLLIVSATILIIPEAWLMRFVPQLWLSPVIVVVMAMFMQFHGARIIRGILCAAMALNILWALINIGFNLVSTAHINYQMTQIKALNQPVSIEYCNYRTFKSNQIRFAEWGIPTVQKNVSGPYIYFVSSSDTRFATTSPLPPVRPPLLIRLSGFVRNKFR